MAHLYEALAARQGCAHVRSGEPAVCRAADAVSLVCQPASANKVSGITALIPSLLIKIVPRRDQRIASSFFVSEDPYYSYHDESVHANENYRRLALRVVTLWLRSQVSSTFT